MATSGSLRICPTGSGKITTRRVGDDLCPTQRFGTRSGGRRCRQEPLGGEPGRELDRRLSIRRHGAGNYRLSGPHGARRDDVRTGQRERLWFTETGGAIGPG